MLPTRQRHPVTRARATNSNTACIRSSVVVLLALCAVACLPFILWQHSNLSATLSRSQPPALTPLQRLQLQKAAASGSVDSASIASQPQAEQQQQQHQQQQQQQHDAHGLVLLTPTAEQVAAAQGYMQDVAVHPKQRHAVPASQYVIDPEPYDMRQQLKQVKAYLASPEFAAKKAARAASGARGIIINAGGPALVSSAIVTLKVLREVLNCTLPVELAWHSPSEMDAATLSALQARWGPIRALDLSSAPWPAHHRQLHGAGERSMQEQHDVGAGAQPRQQQPHDQQHVGFATVAQQHQPHSRQPGSGAEVSAGVAGSAAAEEGLPAERAAAKQHGFVFKVLSLCASSFASALLLDADNLPLADPSGLWEDATFKLHGNLFWPDFWPPGSSTEGQDLAFDMVGLQAEAAEALLSAGKGPSSMSWRGTESGQLLLDLVRHADVAELALWINSFGDSVYRALWGDKDTYVLAFGVAGRAHEFNQLQVPPAGAFAWRPQSVLVKATQDKVDGWQLAGMVQYNALGQAAFLHRTMNKFSWDGQPWQIGLLSAPLPQRWLDYHLSLDSQGPTVGVPVTYAAPASAFTAVSLQQPSLSAAAQPQALGTKNLSGRASAGGEGRWTSTSTGSCPNSAFISYLWLRQQAVPVGPMPSLDTACASLMATLLGGASAHSSPSAANLVQHPELLGIVLSHALNNNAAGSPSATTTAPVAHRPPRQDKAGRLRSGTEQPDASAPVAAWLLQPHNLTSSAAATVAAAAAGSGVGGVIQASYAAFAWMQQHAGEFPLLAHSNERGGGSGSSSLPGA